MADACNVANARFDGGIRPADESARARAKPQDALAPSLDLVGATATATALADIAPEAWAALASRAIEPNAYFLPAWARAVDAHAKGRTGAMALAAWDADKRLIGLAPVVSAWRAYRLPLPLLVSHEAYGVLGTPLVDRDRASDAVAALLAAARARGAHALLLRDIPADGAAMNAIRATLAREGMRARRAALPAFPSRRVGAGNAPGRRRDDGPDAEKPDVQEPAPHARAARRRRQGVARARAQAR